MWKVILSVSCKIGMQIAMPQFGVVVPKKSLFLPLTIDFFYFVYIQILAIFFHFVLAILSMFTILFFL